MRKTSAVFFDIECFLELDNELLPAEDELKDITNREQEKTEVLKQVKLIGEISETMEILRSRDILSVSWSDAAIGRIEGFVERLGCDHFICYRGNTSGDSDPGRAMMEGREEIEEFMKSKGLKREDCLAIVSSGKEGILPHIFDRSLVLVFSREVYGKAGRYLYTDKLAEVLKFV